MIRYLLVYTRLFYYYDKIHICQKRIVNEDNYHQQKKMSLMALNWRKNRFCLQISAPQTSFKLWILAKTFVRVI